MVRIIGLRNEETTPSELLNYKVLDLLNQADSILTEYGFARELEGTIEGGRNYRLYKGLKGIAMIRFVNNDWELIPFMEKGVVKAKCPIFIELRDIPEKIIESLDADLSSIT